MSEKRTVKTELVREWVARNGLPELALKSRVSVHTIMAMLKRTNPHSPKRLSVQLRLADALGVSLDELFPLVQGEGSGPDAA